MKVIIFIFIILMKLNDCYPSNSIKINLENLKLNKKIELDTKNIFDLDAKEGVCKVGTHTETDIIDIIEKMKRKRILDALVDENRSTEEKTIIINNNKYLIFENTKTPSLYCGGLMNDWETNIF